MQTMLKTIFTWNAMRADGGTRYTGLIWGLGYATGASLHYLTVTFSATGNSVTLGWSKVLAIKVLVDCQLITTSLKHSHGKRILQDSRSFKLELWRNIFMEKYGKNQWTSIFLSKYHDDWNHTNPLRGEPGNGTALCPRGVLIAASRPLHKAQRMVASAQILKLCLRWAGNKKEVWGISDIKIIKDSLKELHDELLN